MKKYLFISFSIVMILIVFHTVLMGASNQYFVWYNEILDKKAYNKLIESVETHEIDTFRVYISGQHISLYDTMEKDIFEDMSYKGIMLDEDNEEIPRPINGVTWAFVNKENGGRVSDVSLYQVDFDSDVFKVRYKNRVFKVSAPGIKDLIELYDSESRCRTLLC